MVSPTIRSPRVGVSPAYERSNRVTRRPQHRFNLKTKPYQIQPLMIAPVLPGESLTNIMLQAQSWSDPLAAGVLRNIGWWKEYYFFYVKHRDLPGWERDELSNQGIGSDLIDMIVNNGNLNTHKLGAIEQWSYTPKGGVPFTKFALQRIVEEYFRDEGETAAAFHIDNVPIAQIYGRGQNDWSMRLTLEGDYEDRRVDLDVDNDGSITVDEVERAYIEWAAARDAGLMDMDYEDWIRTYGVKSTLPEIDRVDHHRPELLCHHREFSYPTNTVEPTTGVPATAVGWRTAQQFRKAWLFPEPGWIIGMTVARPKVYLQNQEGSVAPMMSTRDSWLPAVLNDQLNVSHLLIPEASGPLATISDTANSKYWIDLRDLLNYGDQFVNWTPADAPPFVTLPSVTGQRRYASAADAMSFFTDTTNGRFLEDGVVSLAIKGRQAPRYENLVLGRA